MGTWDGFRVGLRVVGIEVGEVGAAEGPSEGRSVGVNVGCDGREVVGVRVGLQVTGALLITRTINPVGPM